MTEEKLCFRDAMAAYLARTEGPSIEKSDEQIAVNPTIEATSLRPKWTTRGKGFHCFLSVSALGIWRVFQSNRSSSGLKMTFRHLKLKV